MAVTDSVSLAEENVINHLVNANENLKDIAEFYDVNEVDLKVWNNLKDTSILRVGEKLIINRKRIKLKTKIKEEESYTQVAEENIEVIGAREHNLKNISTDSPQ